MGVGVKKVQISLVKPSCLNSQFFNSDEQIISGGGDLVGRGVGGGGNTSVDAITFCPVIQHFHHSDQPTFSDHTSQKFSIAGTLNLTEKN